MAVEINLSVGFGFKTGWLAVRDGELAAIAEAVGGRPGSSLDWTVGVRRAYSEPDVVMVTPLLVARDGGLWRLVVGQWIAANHESIDVATLSQALGREVQLFVTHRVVGLHRWDWAQDGVLIRSFEFGDAEVRRWHGSAREVELAIGLPGTFNQAGGASGQAIVIGEADVMRVASAWSIDPTTLDGRPVSGPVSLFNVQIPAGTPEPPDHPLVAFDVTDILMSGEPYEERMARMAQRLRSGGPSGWCVT